MADLGMGRITWTCHICGRERDDADIAVESRSKELIPGRGGELGVNVRYCADSASCSAGAADLADRWMEAVT